METYAVLNNGVKMPYIGFGCAFGNWTDKSKFFGFTPEDAWSSIPAALRAGYRNFDTALVYNTQQILGLSLGKELAEGRLKRSDIFVATKLFHPKASIGHNTIGTTVDIEAYLNDESLDIKAKLLRDFEYSLHELNLGYVDLLLVHWPGQHGTSDKVAGDRLRRQVWEAFEEMYSTGRARAIGVSNFLASHLEPLLRDCKIVPMVNQVEIHPYLAQAELVKYCQEKGIVVQAWSPFASGAMGILQDPALQSIAHRHGKDVGQVILRWLIQRQIAVVPRSSSESRMRGNLDVFDFSLSDDDMEAINALDKNTTYLGSPDSIA